MQNPCQKCKVVILCKIQENPYLYLCAYALIGVRKSTFNTQCSMFNAQCSMLNVQCSMFNVQCYSSALIWNTFYANGATMLQDNLATKSKTNAGTCGLGSEEGNEGMFQHIG